MHYTKIKKEYTDKFINDFISDSEDMIERFMEYVHNLYPNITLEELKVNQDLLLDLISDYEDDYNDHDLEWWSGRAFQFKQMLPDIVRIAMSASNLSDQIKHITNVNLMQEEIQLDLSEEDIQELTNWSEFHWAYNGVKIHVFNSSLTSF